MTICCLCGRATHCMFRMYLVPPDSSLTNSQIQNSLDSSPVEVLPNNPDWRNVCVFCRERVVSVAEFYAFLRNIKSGIVKTTIVEMYRKILNHRIRINVARIMSS